MRKKDFTFRIVVVRLGRRRANGDDHLPFPQAQLGEQRGVGLEKRNVNVLFDAGIFFNVVLGKLDCLIRNDLRHHHPGGVGERKGLGKFIISKDNARYAQKL